MEHFMHGGDWAGYFNEYGKPPMDFSASVSPLGLPESVQIAVSEALVLAWRYPDPLCRELRAALERHHNVPKEYILCGNGAADLIYRLVAALRPRQAVITAPTFSEYKRALDMYGCQVTEYPLEKESDFALSPEFLNAIEPGVELVFLCEPNNPTGISTAPELLRRILTCCEAVGAQLVVDECFHEFLPDPGAYTLLPLLKTHPALTVLRAFTKSYGMPGLRLGYALCSNTKLLENMLCAGPPWAVSSPAQAAGLAALEDEDYSRDLRALVLVQRPRLRQALMALGLYVVPGQANYLLFFCSDTTLDLKLRDRGILIRNCTDFHGLGSGWYRIAVRGEADNNRLIEEMGKVIADG